MERQPKISRFKRRKKANYKKALILIVLLVVLIYLYINADTLAHRLFGE